MNIEYSEAPSVSQIETPQAPEAESEYLGALLAGGKASPLLSQSDDFYQDRHRFIHDAIAALWHAKTPVGVVTVAEQLRKRNHLDIVGGIEYLNALAKAFEYSKPDSATMDAHAALIREKANVRRLLAGNEKVKNAALNGVGVEGALKIMRELDGTLQLRSVKRQTQIGDMGHVFDSNALLQAKLPEPKWAIPGLIPVGFNIFAGKPKQGKSWLIMGVALAVACGGVALGEMNVPQGDCLYLALEDTPHRLQSRIGKMLQGAPAPESLSLSLNWPRMDEGGIELLEAWLKTHPNARLVVIDTWAKVKPMRKRNNSDAYTEDYDATGTLKNLADKYGVACMVVHHMTKAHYDDPIEAISGSMGFSGAADGLFLLQRERRKDEAVLFAQGRDVIRQEIALNWNPDLAIWSKIGDASQVRLSEERREIIQVLEQSDEPLDSAKVARLLCKKEGTVRKLLWEMSNAHEIMFCSRGKYAAMPKQQEI